MKKATTLILFQIVIMACAHVREEDLVSWRNVPVLELEMHPFFSTLPLEKRPLSNGGELWIYSNTVSTAKKDCSFGVCQAVLETEGCQNQFVISKGMVLEYRPVPINIISCVTDCRVRPSSRPCSPD